MSKQTQPVPVKIRKRHGRIFVRIVGGNGEASMPPEYYCSYGETCPCITRSVT